MKIIIIGAGPGGYETAVEAASRGIETIIVTKGPLGGTCLNEGCIPTKCLCSMSSPDMARKEAVISQLQSGIASLLKNKLITLVQGEAELVDEHTVKVGDETFTSDAIIIATGSVSASLPIPGSELTADSSAMLDQASVPERLCIIGGGVIGLEFASIFCNFGSEVTVLEYCPNILPRFDVDLSKRLKASLSRRGIKIETQAKVTSVSKGNSYIVTYEKQGKEVTLQSDYVLMAVGRRPNLSLKGLDAVGIEYSARGIKVDDCMQTSVRGIYAVGDVTGGLMLAHVASAQGRRALDHICGISDSIDLGVVPAAVFTVPEVATVGLSEEDCKSREMDYRVLKSTYRANGKAVAMGEQDGYCKFIVENPSGRIVGAHILGAHASDLIHEAAAYVSLGVTAERASKIIHAHPSLSEVLLSALKN